jgi:hypothetical protein
LVVLDVHFHLSPTGAAECSLSKMRNRKGCRNELSNMGQKNEITVEMMAEKAQIGKQNMKHKVLKDLGPK